MASTRGGINAHSTTTMVSIRTYGQIVFAVFVNGCFAILLAINSCRPTGGVMDPMQKIMTVRTPK